MKKSIICETNRSIELTCECIPMGKDLTLAVYGGEVPHIGAAVMAVARPSLTGKGTSATSSVLACTGHKDDVIARRFAEAAAIKKNCVCVCTCGIHMEQLQPEELKKVSESCEELLRQVLEIV